MNNYQASHLYETDLPRYEYISHICMFDVIKVFPKFI